MPLADSAFVRTHVSTVNSGRAIGPGKNPELGVAFALGWHLVELRHLVEDSGTLALTKLLTDTAALSFDDRAELIKNEIASEVNGIFPDVTSKGQTMVSTLKPKESNTIDNMNTTLRKDLAGKDFRLRKSYEVGVALAESSLISFKLCKGIETPEKTLPEDLAELFSSNRIACLVRDMRDLKTSFPDHAVDAVSATLEDWGTWVRDNATKNAKKTNWEQIAQHKLYPQAQAWRSLLSCEREPIDLLQVPDYVSSLKRLLGQYWALARGFVWRWSSLLLVLPMAALAYIAIALFNDKQLGGALGAGAALLAFFGLSGATVAAAVKGALAQAENHLWAAELSAAVASAIDYVPERIDGSVRRLHGGVAIAPGRIDAFWPWQR
jgi:hypothetical protein